MLKTELPDYILLSWAKAELEEQQAHGDWSPCGLYDLVRYKDKLYRAQVGLFRKPLMHSPLPARFWALPRLVERRTGDDRKGLWKIRRALRRMRRDFREL